MGPAALRETAKGRRYRKKKGLTGEYPGHARTPRIPKNPISTESQRGERIQKNKHVGYAVPPEKADDKQEGRGGKGVGKHGGQSQVVEEPLHFSGGKR